MANISTSAKINVPANAETSAIASTNTQANVSVSPQFTSASVMNELKNACQKKTYLGFKNLQPGEYIVNLFSIVETTHGKRVRVDSGENYLLLPERFVKIMTPEKIIILNLSSKIMVYSGKDSSDRDRLLLDFRDADDYMNDLVNFNMMT